MTTRQVDETRHIAFGVRLLADLFREDPGPVQDAIVEELRLVLPWRTCVAQIPAGRTPRGSCGAAA